MMMSKLLLILFGFNLFSTTDSLEVESKIEAVTVFEKGALLSRTIDLNSMNGTTEIIINKLNLSIDRKSIEIVADDALEIVSVKNEVYTDSVAGYLKTYASFDDEFQRINDSIRLYKRFLNVLNDEWEIFEDNDDFETESDGVNIDNLEKASRLYKTRLREIELERFEIDLKIRDFNQEISTINEAFYKLKNKNVKQYLRVRILAKPTSIGTKNMILKYFIPEAGWTPYYDARVSDKDSETLRLDLKANVFQTTGESWEEVKLTLTNSDPTKSQTPPMMKPFFLDRDTYYYNHQNLSYGQGMVIDESGEPLIGANVVIKGTTIGTITDIDGSFSLPQGVGRTLVVSYTGFATTEILTNGDSPLIVLQEGALLDEVVVTGYGEISQSLQGRTAGVSVRGSRSKATDYYIDGVRYKDEVVKRERQAISVAKTESFTSVNFELEVPYTIKSSSDASEVLLDKKGIKVDYYYQILPRLTNDAFLMASIPQWEDYDLLPAPVNIYHNNTFKGNTRIDPDLIKDTMEFSIGVDPEVVVSREQLKDFTKKNFLKNKISEEMAWEIKVKNAKRKNIILKIKDQYPVSNDKGIKVELLESGEADIDKKRGLLNWKIELAKGGIFKNNLIYKVKYPSDQKLVLI